MNIRTLKRSNVNMRKFEAQERKLINLSKKSNQAEESIMEKHYTGETNNGERTWRF